MSEQFSADELAEIHASMALHEAMIVKGEIVGDKVYMESPYNPDLVARIRQTQMGKWSAAKKRWVFPTSRLDKVKELYKEFYGEDGFTEAVKATVEIDIDKAKAAGLPIESKSKALWFMGLQLARTFGPDKKPRVDKAVTVLSGGFVSAGSSNLPEVETQPGTRITLSDVPMDPLVQLLAGKGDSAGVTVTGSTAPGGMPVSAPASVAPTATATPSTSTSTGSSPGATAPTGAGADSSASGGITFNDLVDVEARTKYLQMELMIKAMATRAAQLPEDVVDDLLATVGLKRKK